MLYARFLVKNGVSLLIFLLQNQVMHVMIRLCN